MISDPVIGELFRCEEHDVASVLSGVGRYTLCYNDPPWSALAPLVAQPVRLVPAWNMDLAHLESLAAHHDDGEVVIGLGGGTALDTAKFIAWKHHKRLIQIPTITSVDAGFTNAIGVRCDGKVRYHGTIVPELVVLDIPLIQSAPQRFNRAGIGDILSCHTGLLDWQLAAEAGHGPRWDDDLAALGRRLLDDLNAATSEIANVSVAGIRFIADAYRHIGAACAAAGHSRFEEGSEHFWAYAYEHSTGSHPVHGEIISLAVCAIAHVQDNRPEVVADIVARAHTRAHPADLGVNQADFVGCLVGLAEYARNENLDRSVADFRPITNERASAAWEFVQQLPRRISD